MGVGRCPRLWAACVAVAAFSSRPPPPSDLRRITSHAAEQQQQQQCSAWGVAMPAAAMPERVWCTTRWVMSGRPAGSEVR